MMNLLIEKPHRQGVQYVIFDGVAYQAHGWFGCQLRSFERRKPDPFKSRILRTDQYCYEVYPFRINRRGLFKYEICWALPQTENYDDYTRKCCRMYDDLFRWR